MGKKWMLSAPPPAPPTTTHWGRNFNQFSSALQINKNENQWAHPIWTKIVTAVIIINVKYKTESREQNIWIWGGRAT